METVNIRENFVVKENPEFVHRRLQIFNKLHEKYAAETSNKAVTITLRGTDKKFTVSGNEAKPSALVKAFGLKVKNPIVVAKLVISGGPRDDSIKFADSEEIDNEESNEILWDMSRIIEDDCEIEFLAENTKEGFHVLQHSSAHILGACIEAKYGALLTVGPALERGFYYDSYIGKLNISADDYPVLEEMASKTCESNVEFTRLKCTKSEALELFNENPFKLYLINKHIPEGGYTSIYRCGSFVDLCKGPHVPHSNLIKTILITSNSMAYWLADSKNQQLQRIYGRGFTSIKEREKYINLVEQAKLRDHRLLGTQYNLFMIDSQQSPGSCFWFPAGALVYNNLMSFLRNEYYIRGYTEVITPNMYNCSLWKTSGHYENYKENLFLFDVEKAEWGLKPMNCPGHCLMFRQMWPSYRDMPIRYADFGVLHRNELSGSLTGLTRVRRFQQDDAHIFCRMDQLKDEVLGCLDFLKFVYDTFGFKYAFKLSTRPPKYFGAIADWDKAEGILAGCLDSAGYKWQLNKGDGAFYGPKIDIILEDALEREHQCGTIQCDFQTPIRFDLKYQTGESVEENEENNKRLDSDQGDGNVLSAGYARPVMVHRAILGSIERFFAILLEHTNAKFPFWLSPWQATILTVTQKSVAYGEYLYDHLKRFGFNVKLNKSDNTISKKIREAHQKNYLYTLIVGEAEEAANTITLRSNSTTQQTFTLEQLIKFFQEMPYPSSQPANKINSWDEVKHLYKRTDC